MLRDETGEDFVDAAAARGAAVKGISELIAEQIAAGRRVDLRHRIEIEDDRGEITCLAVRRVLRRLLARASLRLVSGRTRFIC